MVHMELFTRYVQLLLASSIILPPYQIISRSGFSKCVVFIMHLDIYYV
jgi:hypothetical protein